MTKLIDEAPLLVLPTLAVVVGLNEAIILQQSNFWMNLYGQPRNGRKWFWKTQVRWEQDFPFWSGPTIRRAIENVETRKLLLSTDLWNTRGGDRTKWYSVDTEAVNALVDQKQLIKMISRTDQSDQLSLEEIDQKNVVEEIDQQHLSFLSSAHAHTRMGFLIEKCELLTSVPVDRLAFLVSTYGMDQVAEYARWYCFARDTGSAKSGGWLTDALAKGWNKPIGLTDGMYISETENLKRFGRSSKWEEIES